jgi:hypothetical protein
MFDEAARAYKANPPFRADGANAHVIWRIENADDPGCQAPSWNENMNCFSDSAINSENISRPSSHY